jgi:hypothetical protein
VIFARRTECTVQLCATAGAGKSTCARPRSTNDKLFLAKLSAFDRRSDLTAKAKFTGDDIRVGLVSITRDAVKLCHKKFRSHSMETNQGLEKIFEDAFFSAIDLEDWNAKTQVDRRSFGIKDKFRPNGRVDMVITHDDGHRVGIEFKVCQFPRMKWTSPNQSTYDIGQIAWDFGSLKTYGVESGYCIVVLHGGLVDMPSVTEAGIARSFHNAMFTDYMSAKQWGYLKYAQQPAASKRECKLLKRWASASRTIATNPYGFCKLFKAERLAVVGLSGK